MALIQCDFFSETLGLCMTMNVILPQSTSGSQIGIESQSGSGRHPTLFLLHGLSDDHSIWLRRTSIERYVAPLGLAVVMPAVHRSFYTDMKHGGKYWTYISEELPRLAREFFPLSHRREDTFVAGLSMGGYGALKLALNHPNRFAAAASLSGATRMDVDAMFDPARNDRVPEMLDVFGSKESFVGSENDLAHLVQHVAGAGVSKPRIYQCCGTEDFLYAQNQSFKKLIEPLGYDYTYEEEPGAHEWGYWDMKIQRVLEWLEVKRHD